MFLITFRISKDSKEIAPTIDSVTLSSNMPKNTIEKIMIPTASDSFSLSVIDLILY